MKTQFKNRNAEIAHHTLAIIHDGYYEFNDQKIDIKNAVDQCIANTHLYRPEDFSQVLTVTEKKLNELQFNTTVDVQNCTTLEGIAQLIDSCNHLGVLNFASAKNPGGGFQGGAQAQEESIARSSSLFPSINQMSEMYKFNRSRRTYLYSDYMIYSPNVIVFKDDHGNLLAQPHQVSIVTSPATNIGAIQNNKPEEMADVEKVMFSRIDKMLAVFVDQGCTNLVLGAWGCGVFRNHPEKIASYFSHYLKPGGKYNGAFETILFAVLDRKDRGIFSAFEKLKS
jgi:uncharacterized protein (TIGR02452 family)